MKIRFKDFIKDNRAGVFLTNPFWLEHLLNLYFQGYYGEIWEEIVETQINTDYVVKSTAYGIIVDVLKLRKTK